MNETHYYQPGFTLVGGGYTPVEYHTRQEKDLIHPNTVWIKGLPEGLDTPGVCSNYSPFHCTKTFKELSTVTSGKCVFTFPNAPIKCAGAPQKVLYYGEDIVKERGYRDKTNFIYATSLPRLFGVEAYLGTLQKIAKEKNIDVRTRHNLIEVDTKNKIAKFELLDENAKPNGKFDEIPVKNFTNIFAAGDCMNTPNAKTAAAVSSHLKTIDKNLTAAMEGKELPAKYDGYASCPIIVGKRRGMLAEFNSKGPMETLPINQAKPGFYAFLMKRYLMAFLYWNFLVKGWWNGPSTIRKILHLGFVPKQK
ncbi:unnamed protein product [Cylicocyclus nassatus]|uniref:Sulfide:quinone oxidoreductase, mitochondrial n=1 Tax=Cylicocyclus nassatus TaxID=53992 RepID=A0AA36MAR5_CYLNA|nr:unnamed protein product [Cylicocyclus nassatus]